MNEPAGPTGTVAAPGTLSAFLEDVSRMATPDREAAPAAPAPGQRIGRFEVVRELGRGGFGAVVEARDGELDRPVALKFLLPSGRVAAPDAALRAEADAIARLSHPNIVQIYDRGACEQGPFLVLELLEGEPLSRRIERGAVRPAEAARIALEVARGLAHAHVRGVVHRDLKPGNVFLCSDGQVKILDFGLAHLVQREDRPGGGTPGWMAPEQRRGAPGDERSDVWALGAILSRMLAGPDPAPGRLSVPGAPELEALVEAMLSPDPARRPRDASRVVEALEPIVRRPVVSPRTAPLAPVAAGLARAWRTGREALVRRRGVALAGLALLCAAALAPLAARTVRRWTSPPPPPGERVLVAVADFANATDDRDLESLSGLLITSLEQSRRVTTLTRARMLEILRQLGHSGAERIDETLGREVARQAGAVALLTATIHRFDDLYSVDLKALDPSSSTYLFSLEERGRGKSGIPALIDRLSDRTRESLREEAGDVREARIELARATTANLEAYAHYFKGQAREQRAEYLAAVAEYEAALGIDPTFAQPQLEIAYLAEFGGASEERERKALDALFAAIDRLPLKERLLAQAWKAHAEERQEEAHRLYARALEAFPADKQVLYLAGDLHYHDGDVAGGLPYLQRAFELDPTDASTADHLIDSLVLEDRPDEAVAVARRLAGANPDGTDMLIRALELTGADDRALAVAREAAARGRPADVMAYADLLAERGDLALAEQRYRAFTGPGTPPDLRMQAWHGLMDLAARRGRMRDALDLALRADALPGLGPDSIAHTRLTAVHIALGTPGGLASVGSQLERLERGSGPSIKVLALLAEIAGEPDVARRFEPRLAREAAPVLAAIRGGTSPRTLPRLRPGTEALNYAAMLLAQRRGRDAETVNAARFTSRWWIKGHHWGVWALPRAGLAEAAALLRLGDRAGAEAAFRRVARDLDRPDRDLPWLPELRRLEAAIGKPALSAAKASREGASRPR